MDKDKDKKVSQIPISQAQLTGVQVLQQTAQKVIIKHNAKSLMEQETAEVMEKFISMAINTATVQENEIKGLKEKLSKYEKQEKKP